MHESEEKRDLPVDFEIADREEEEHHHYPRTFPQPDPEYHNAEHS